MQNVYNELYHMFEEEKRKEKKHITGERTSPEVNIMCIEVNTFQNNKVKAQAKKNSKANL